MRCDECEIVVGRACLERHVRAGHGLGRRRNGGAKSVCDDVGDPSRIHKDKPGMCFRAEPVA